MGESSKKLGDYWSSAPQDRGQLVLFPTKLDDVLTAQHPVRLLDEILGQIDWSAWEGAYHGGRGQPPIHPRVLVAVLLYGLLKRVRSSRALEEALLVRIDFRWLVEGRSIDHATLSAFRSKHSGALKDLFVKVGLVAQRLGLLPLAQLAFDGTRIKANNRRSGTRTPERLKELRQELSEKYAQLEQKQAEADAREASADASAELPRELADTERRLSQVERALAELERAEAAGEAVPKRVPTTDPQSRVSPNKEGGYAPNYTPLATVDADSGLIVGVDVIASSDEEHYLVDQVEQVERDFGLERAPGVMLTDGRNATGENLRALEEKGVRVYSPAGPGTDPQTNPALREDPSQGVAESDWERLPTKQVKGKPPQLAKEAFVYVESEDVYRCPLGKPLERGNTTSEKAKGRPGVRLVRTRYKTAEGTCVGCPLAARCLQPGVKRREVSRYEHDALKQKLALRMATPEARQKYARRREVGERPFAVIKHQLGVRQFLLRGLEKVCTEWRWLAVAFNLDRLISHALSSHALSSHALGARAGPATTPPP